MPLRSRRGNPTDHRLIRELRGKPDPGANLLPMSVPNQNATWLTLIDPFAPTDPSTESRLRRLLHRRRSGYTTAAAAPVGRRLGAEVVQRRDAAAT